ncbi:MAG: hypothetical protein P8077_03415, partial [Gammaproteobacteria bacterium]
MLKTTVFYTTTHSNIQRQIHARLKQFLNRAPSRPQPRSTGGDCTPAANTLLNFAGVKPDLLPFVCDAAPAKQEKYLPLQSPCNHIGLNTPLLMP